MTGKHTPGPWERTGKTVYALMDGAIPHRPEKVNRFSAHVEPGRGIEDAEMLANARLIAAAPDLLEALEGLLNTAGMGRDAWTKAEAALTKAKGEEGTQ